MLSSCWLTSPFTGCFNSELKGEIGSIEGSPAKSRQTEILLPSKEKAILNGSAGGKTTLGGPTVTTTAPRSSYANQVITGRAKESESANHTDIQPAQTPRKSKSMGRIHGSGGGNAKDNVREGITNPLAVKDEGSHVEAQIRGHRRVPSDGVTWRHSKALEGENVGMEDEEKSLKRTYKSEYRKKFRPFSQYQYIDGKFQKSRNDEVDSSKAWYKEVVELRRQAGQYRCRGWGVETASERMTEIYSKQLELWDQVSKRSSLQALSLATSAAPSRPISKAEKELENSRRSSPLKHSARDRHITASARPPKPVPLHKTDKPEKTSKEITPRHHYEKTTGSAGHFITSPTRIKLDPAYPNGVIGGRIPRKSPSAKSPIKDLMITKKSSPRTFSVARISPTKEKKTSLARSVSVGPENRSPKRISRPPSTHVPLPTTKNERRPRPTSLSANSRRKDNSVVQSEKRSIKKPFDVSGSPKRSDFKAKEDKKRANLEDAKKFTKDVPLRDATDAIKDSFSARKVTPEPRFYPDKYEPVVKTPPEPTRVKSPDQVPVKSPDPVNWTVPLDTGKTFTVTHNVPEGSPTKRLAKGEASRSTSSSEHRSRQTPEPTKIYQGSIAGTPITTAGSTMPSEPVAVTSSGSSVPLVHKIEDKPQINSINKGINPSKASKDSETSINKVNTQVKVEPSHIVTFNEDVTTEPNSVTNENLASSEKSEQIDEKPSKVKTATSLHSAVDDTKSKDLKQSVPLATSTKPHEEPFINQPSYNNSTSSGFSTETQDPMTMSIFGSLNGVGENTKTNNQVTPVNTNLTNTNTKSVAGVIAGSNLRRLDDPFLEQSSYVSKAPITSNTTPPVAPLDPMTSSIYKIPEAPPSLPENKENKSVSQEKPVATAPYRVLEAPVDIPEIMKPAPYRILEAPLAEFSNPKSDPINEIKQPTQVVPPFGKTMSESLDKAHNRLDTHWSAGDEKAPENV